MAFELLLPPLYDTQNAFISQPRLMSAEQILSMPVRQRTPQGGFHSSKWAATLCFVYNKIT